MPKEKGQHYNFVEIHKFSPMSHSEYEERFSVYIPLMAGESSEGYQPETSISLESINELKSSRSKFSDFFTDFLSTISDKNLNPRAKMKNLICSAAIKAAEISLWTTYSLVHLSTDEKIRIAKSAVLEFSKESILKSREYINRERNERAQTFRLVQIKMQWKENEKRKSAWSKITPIEPGTWFDAVDDPGYSRTIEKKALESIPKIVFKQNEISEIALDRINRFKSIWDNVVVDRHYVSRLAAEVNDFKIDDSRTFFEKDNVVKQLDDLLTLESCIKEEPTLANPLCNLHMNLAMKFLRYSSNEDPEVDFSKNEFEFENIVFEPVVYDLADNQPNILTSDDKDILF